MRSLIQFRSKKPNGSINTYATSIFKDPNVAKHLSYIHDKYVVVPTDITPNNIVCKSHYIYCLINELYIANSIGNLTYTPMTLNKDGILDNQMSVLCFFRISTKDVALNRQSLYWKTKLHKCPYKQRYIAGSSEYSTKSLS